MSGIFTQFMENSKYLKNLKIKLESIHDIQPEALDRIIKACQQTKLKINHSLVFEQHTVAYVGSGLLKEYDSKHHDQPLITNFISNDQFFFAKSKSHFLKAIKPTMIYYWKFAALLEIYKDFTKLDLIYQIAEHGYEERLSLRGIILEKHSFHQKLALFIISNLTILPLLNRKDMANYIGEDYVDFTSKYNKVLCAISPPER